MGLADIQKEDVLASIKEYDKLTGPVFLRRYRFGEAKTYFIHHEGKRYDSKAIMGYAHGVRTGIFWTTKDFTGGEDSVVSRLRHLGFEVPKPAPHNATPARAPGYFYVYVPHDSSEILDVGLHHGIWGWRSAVLDKSDYRTVTVAMQPGDYLIFGTKGPNPRVPPGGWGGARMQQVAITRIVEPLFRADSKVWSVDDFYPERVLLEVLSSDGTVPLADDALEALRNSANQGGVPRSAGALDVVAVEAAFADEEDTELLDIDNETDVLARVLVRREQRKLRKKKFGDAQILQCDLCARTFPRRLMWLAHIKKRAHATFVERKDMANLMAACKLGCDDLFEHGYISVDGNGTIEANARTVTTTDIEHLAQQLAGRKCGAFTKKSATYFDWHRKTLTAPI